MPEPCLSFFDFDNTLYKGTSRYIILDFATYLTTRNHFPASQFEILQKLFKSYFAGTLSRHDFGVRVVEAFYRGLEGYGEMEIHDLALDFIQDQGEATWFPHTLPLLKLVTPFVRSILVSGSPVEILEPVNQILRLNEVHASQGVTENGVFSGETRRELATASAKQDFMVSLSRTRPFDVQRSMAFGDSESDFPLFEAVAPDNAFLITNQLKLKQVADKNHWHFILQEGPVVETIQLRIGSLFQP